MPARRQAGTVLLLAPTGRDSTLAAAILREAGFESLICADPVILHAALDETSGFVVISEEATRSADLTPIAAWIEHQPSWSDLPVIILTHHGGGPERNPRAAALSTILGNVTFLERPFHPTTFASVARTAMRGRQRQFEARARITELHESEERLRTALQAGRLGSWSLDLDSFELTASETCKAVFGRAPDAAFAYQDLLAAIHPDDAARMREAVARCIDEHTDYAIEYRTIWPDGSVHWAAIHARLLHDQAADTVRLVGVSSDITHRKAVEETLRHLNETLEQRVAERTRDLRHAHDLMLAESRQREQAETQLRQAQKMETIGQLTGGVAHDFNNLLMAVLGNLELLRKRLPADPKILRLLDGALLGAQRGAALTQRLLAFARRQELKVGPVDLSALIGGMADLLERSVGPGLDIRVRETPGLPPALVDANQVELALLNLVVNARDAMQAGGTLTIELDRAECAGGDDLAPGTYLRLAVVDTGHGMDSATLKRAIDPFFSTKELGKGTGLGLSMVHGLAVQLNGTLRLASERGRGTRAELWLPATSPGAASALSPAEERSPLPDRSFTILLVDDDALIAMSTVDMLDDLGHDVIEAGSGAAALAILRARSDIDLLITDYSMPEMTGAQLARQTRILRPDLPILLATGYADLPSGTGMDLPRLAKPYQQAQLAAAIADLLSAAALPIAAP